MTTSSFAAVTEALGWTLLHFVWQGAVVALALWCVLRATRKASPQVRYVAGCTALALMSVAAVSTFAWQLSLSRVNAAKPPSTPQPAPFASQIVPEASAVTVSVERPTGVDDFSPPETALSPGKQPPATSPQPAAVDFQNVREMALLLRPWLPWIVGVWAAGVMLLSFRLLTGWRVIRRIRRDADEIADDMWTEHFARMQQLLGVSRAVRLLCSASAGVPMVVGWLKPVVLIPAGLLTGLSSSQLEAILAHELAHVRRYDYLVNLLQNVVETLLFYHPAVWWVSAQVRTEREHCCDDTAAAACGNTLDYARALAALEELRQAPAVLSVAANGGSLLGRIRRLVGVNEAAPGHSGWPVAAMILLLCVGITLVATISGEGDDRSSTSRPNDTPAANDEQPPETDRETLQHFPSQVGVSVRKLLSGIDLPFVTDEFLGQAEDLFTAFIKQRLPAEATLPDERRKAILQSLDERGQSMLGSGKLRDERQFNGAYLSFPDRLLTLQWKIDQAMQRGPLSETQQQPLNEQRDWMREFIGQSEETRFLSHKEALDALERKFSDPLCPVFDGPMSDEQFEGFKKTARDADWEIQYAIPHLVFTALNQLYRNSSAIELPFPDRVTRYGQTNGIVSLGFASNARFRGDTRALDDVDKGHTYVDATTGDPHTAPADVRTAGDDDKWLRETGKGDFGYDDGNGGGLFAVRGAKLVMLNVANWYEADKVSDEELRKHLEQKGGRTVSLTDFFKRQRRDGILDKSSDLVPLPDFYKVHRRTRLGREDPWGYIVITVYVGVLTREGRLSVVQVEESSGIESIAVRVRPREVRDRDKHEQEHGHMLPRIEQKATDRNGALQLTPPDGARIELLGNKPDAVKKTGGGGATSEARDDDKATVGHAPPVDRKVEPNWGPTHQGLQAAIIIEPRKEEHSIGDVIDVRVFVRNVSDQPRDFSDTFSLNALHVTSTDGSYRRFGFAHFFGFRPSRPSHRYTLATGHEVMLNGSFNIHLQAAGDDREAKATFTLTVEPDQQYRLLVSFGDGDAALPDSAPTEADGTWVSGETRLKIDAQRLEQLIKQLSSEDGTVRGRAAYRLGLIGQKAAPAIPHLINQFGDLLAPVVDPSHDHGTQISVVAMNSLARIGEPAVEPLIAAMLDKQVRVDRRGCSAQVLGMIGDARAIEPLIQALSDDEQPVRLHASMALKQIGEPALARLAAAVDNEDPRVRLGATVGLSDIKGALVTKLLLRRLRDSDPSVRIAAANALRSRTDDSVVVEALIESLNDPHDEAREAVYTALCYCNDSRLPALFLAGLNDPYKVVRWRSAEGLGASKTREAVIPLLAATESDDTSLRDIAIRSLGKIGDKRALERLIMLARTDADPTTRETAGRAIGELEHPDHPPSEVAWGDPVDGVQLGLRCTTGIRPYRIGEVIRFERLIRNGSERDRTFKVTEGGQILPHVEENDISLHSGLIVNGRFGMRTVHVAAGKTELLDTTDFTILAADSKLLGPLSDLRLKPGTYTVSTRFYEDVFPRDGVPARGSGPLVTGRLELTVGEDGE